MTETRDSEFKRDSKAPVNDHEADEVGSATLSATTTASLARLRCSDIPHNTLGQSQKHQVTRDKRKHPYHTSAISYARTSLAFVYRK
jgi:hypothetical protein